MTMKPDIRFCPVCHRRRQVTLDHQAGIVYYCPWCEGLDANGDVNRVPLPEQLSLFPEAKQPKLLEV